MFLPIPAARRPSTFFALTVFAIAIPGVALAMPEVAPAIFRVALAIPRVALAIPRVALAIPSLPEVLVAAWMFLPVPAARRPSTFFALTVFAIAIPGVALTIPPGATEFRTLLMPIIAPPPRLFPVRLPLAPIKGFLRAIAFLSKIIVAPEGSFFAPAPKTPPLILVLASKAALAESFSGPSSASLFCSGTALASKGPVAPPMRRSVVFVVAAGHEGPFLDFKSQLAGLFRQYET